MTYGLRINGSCLRSNVITTCCYLHNFIRRSHESTELYTPPGFIDTHRSNGPDRNDGAWRKEGVYGSMSGLLPLKKVPRKSAGRAKLIQDEFENYFSSLEGKVPWPIPYH